ncbi:MAG: trypsin-like peptidase domain-containing protein [Planctomycetaceae bacterium]|nr:trypsin-like peptidase domain-containing protein [Planctomycetaceae bacterium]
MKTILFALAAAIALSAGAAHAGAAGTGFLAIEPDEPPAELRDGSALLLEAGRHMARVSAAVSPSVVHILAEHPGTSGTVEETGSGILMTSPKSGGVFILTNRHVILNARLNQIAIHLQDGRVIQPINKLEDKATDVAVLIVNTPDLTPGRWGDSDNLDIGHIVLAMGSPFGLSKSVTMGIISAKGRRSLDLGGERREVINQDFLQTDAAINPGNSGGPLIDLQGRVVGINTAIASQGGGNEGIGFSIPINLARFVVDQLFEHGRVHRGFLGVRLDDHFDDTAAKRYGLTRRMGARVAQVYPETPAAKADIRVDDLILDFNGIAIEDENHLIHLVSLTELHRPVRIIVQRNGQQQTLSITLMDRDDVQQAEPQRPARSSGGGGGASFRSSGMTLHRLDAGIAAQLGYRAAPRGLLVMEVPSGDDPDALQLYDVIEAVGRSPVATPEEFDAALSGQPAGSVLLRVRRIIAGEEVVRLVLLPR